MQRCILAHVKLPEMEMGVIALEGFDQAESVGCVGIDGRWDTLGIECGK